MAGIKPIILYVSEGGKRKKDFFREFLGLEVIAYEDAEEVMRNHDPSEFNVAIIDAGDDHLGYGRLSERLKRDVGDRILIIGISIFGRYLPKDPDSRKVYDETIGWECNGDLFKSLQEILERRGFDVRITDALTHLIKVEKGEIDI